MGLPIWYWTGFFAWTPGEASHPSGLHGAKKRIFGLEAERSSGPKGSGLLDRKRELLVSLSCPNQLAGLLCHERLFVLRRVVIAVEMQDPVGEEEPHLVFESALSSHCLALGCVEGDDDVAEESKIVTLLGYFWTDEFCLGEREHVGRLVLVAVLGVDGLDPGVVAQEDAELRRFEGKVSEHPLSQSSYEFGAQRSAPGRSASYENGHLG